MTVSFQPDGVIIQDERESRKEQLLQVVQRVQSEYSFRYVALGGTSHEDLSGLASTDEYVIIIITIIIRVFVLEFKMLKFLFFCCLNIFLGNFPRFSVHKSLKTKVNSQRARTPVFLV